MLRTQVVVVMTRSDRLGMYLCGEWAANSLRWSDQVCSRGPQLPVVWKLDSWMLRVLVFFFLSSYTVNIICMFVFLS